MPQHPLLPFLITAAALLGCAQEPTGAAASAPSAPSSTEQVLPSLSVKALSDSRVAVELAAADDRRPRMVDVRVKWSDGWTLGEHTVGAAASASGKEVVVQPAGSSSARIIVYSASNTQRLQDGTLVELALLAEPGTASGSIEILATPPMFAPTDAEQGLHIGEPLKLLGNRQQ